MNRQHLENLGRRAHWLQTVLTQLGAGLVPRDRDILTLVALEVGGVSRSWLAAPSSRPGISGPAAARRADQLVRQGVLAVRGTEWLDITEEDQ